ncbi:amino acid permease [Halodesulfovibrio spirochaetisodalis]|uniref:Aromatic amino acid permease n=1 Tax=Halodesulfovibrio spirochaetisodalis TaxID=1560234 RepID=A0A1B7XPW0_9BACT|nr:aromatic amino acid transport family protein [Halodesulfovibrio spirochaetisodalis]OBQ57552.1 hypothetical protein SP90_00440 [Halodesulfovibrio spirochaetisodalis]
MKSQSLDAVFVVAGTTIGAGMLGLPMAIGFLGFKVSMVLLLVMWALAFYTSLLLLEVNLQVGTGLNVNMMVKKVLGRGGQVIAVLCLAFLLYAVLVAYVTAMGGIIASALDVSGDAFSTGLCAVGFSVAMAVIMFCGTNAIIRFNSLFFMTMLVAMAVAFATLSTTVNTTVLLNSVPNYDYLVAAIPVLFASFSFHFCIPSITSVVGTNTRQLVRIMFWGTLLPLLCYMLWLFLSLGSVPMDQIVNMSGSVDALIKSMCNGSVVIQTILSVFAAFALVTSFFGVALSLFDLMAETLRRGNSAKERMGTTFIVFVPVVIASLLAPGGFIAALAHAGAALAVICILLPCAMSFKLRREAKAAAKKIAYMTPGGSMGIATAAVCGVVILVANYV